MIHYNDLPDVFPIHFDARGNPDGYGEPSDLFGLPIISLITVVFVQFINRNMIKINPHKMGAKNEAQLSITKVLMAQLALYCVVLFGWIAFQSMIVAVGKASSLSNGLLAFSFIMPIILLVLYYYRLIKSKERKAN